MRGYVSLVFFLGIYFFISSKLILGDTIFFQNGTMRSNLTVKQDQYDKIIYDTENVLNITISNHIVTRIEYSDAPGVYIDGQNALLRADYSAATKAMADAIEIAKKPPLIRDWIKHYALFYQARAYHGWAERIRDNSKFQQAIEYYQKTLESDEKGHFVLECYWQKANIYIKLKQYDQATTELKKLSNITQNLDSKDLWQFRIVFLQGHLAKAKGNFDDAIEQYTEARKIAIAQKRSYDMQEAILAIGEVYIIQKDFSKAENYFSKLIQEYPGQKEIEAGIKNGLAWCSFHQKNYDKARTLALDVFLKYPQVVQQQPMALYILARCYEKISKSAPSTDSPSQIYYDWLKTSYPDSEWAKKIGIED